MHFNIYILYKSVIKRSWVYTFIFIFSAYFTLCLHWKSATVNFLWVYFVNSCAIITNINVITCFVYIYLCNLKMKWNVQLYKNNLMCTFEKKSLNYNYSLIKKKDCLQSSWHYIFYIVNMAAPCMFHIPDYEGI